MSQSTTVSSLGLISSTSGGVLALTLDRPERFNAITVPMVQAAADAIDRAAADPAVRVITITGAGKAFCSGADLRAADPSDAGEAPDVTTIDAVNRLAFSMRAAPQLVVALVNGPAVGVGSSFVLGADVAIASSSAYLKTGFSSIGLMPDGGGTAYLSAALGRNRTLALAVLDDRIDAESALAMGLFARVFPDEEFRDRAGEVVARLATGPSRAYAAIKSAVDRTTLPGLAGALEFERSQQRLLLASPDFHEGVAAFTGKRPPRFTGE